MNDTIVIFRVPKVRADDLEMWIETVLDRRGIALPFRKATLGDRGKAVDMADAMLWVPNKHEEQA